MSKFILSFFFFFLSFKVEIMNLKKSTKKQKKKTTTPNATKLKTENKNNKTKTKTINNTKKKTNDKKQNNCISSDFFVYLFPSEFICIWMNFVVFSAFFSRNVCLFFHSCRFAMRIQQVRLLLIGCEKHSLLGVSPSREQIKKEKRKKKKEREKARNPSPQPLLFSRTCNASK